LDLVEQLTAELLKLVIEQLDHMKVIENDRGRWQVFRDGTYVGLGHAHGHGLDACPGSPQPSPERLQRFGPVAIADKDHTPGVQIQNDCQILLTLADGDLVDGDLSQVLQLRPGEVNENGVKS
jgi:hypothetical protein